MNKNIRLFYDSAVRLGLSVHLIPEFNCLQVKLKKNYLFFSYFTPYNNTTSMYLAKNKLFLNTLLKNKGFPVTKAVSVHRTYFSKASLEELTKSMQFPLVIKPTTDTFGGEGVICNIKDATTLYKYLVQSMKTYPSMQIEEFQQGFREYRVLMFKKRILGIVQRLPPVISGDGKHSIKELIHAYNQNVANNNTANPLIIDDECKHCLADQGLTLNSVIKLGEPVKLSFAVNHARGGKTVSLSKKIPDYNRIQLKRIAETIGLDLVGLDILCENIQKSFKKTRWMVLETNIAPDISLHELPDEGKKHCVSKKILLNLILRHPIAYMMNRLKQLKVFGRGHFN